jgi:pyruvate-formate lyase-activating enzyme
MLAGEKPKGCQYCWNIESLEGNHISDRHERNASIYTEERLGAIKANPLAPVNPEYIEISFGNECNFKCGYCHPKHSSAYYKEIKDFGPYTMVKNHRNDIDWFQIYEEE